MNLSQSERLISLNKTAREQMNLLKKNKSYEELNNHNFNSVDSDIIKINE
jgi:hypothetical protein